METPLEIEVNMWRIDLECREEEAVIQEEKERLYNENNGEQIILSDSGVFCCKEDFVKCEDNENEEFCTGENLTLRLS